jgi:ATP-dependent DNA helicase Rep
MTLNPEQQRAVDHLDGPLLVLAGAGSGKTRVITHKIAGLVRRGAFAAGEIAAVTFTNKAAREMRERVAGLVDAETAAALRVSTFHRLGLDILRREYAHAGLKRNFTILDASDSRALLKDLLRADNADTEDALEAARGRISDWKNALVHPADALAGAEDGETATRARQYAAYQEALASYNAVDFDDLIGLPVTVLRDQPGALDAWRARIRYLLGDEYQDTNGAQYELMRLLIGDRGAFTVVGDDDQSIYAWRGARPDNLQALARDYPGLSVVKLEQNYRSSGRILAAANALISNNPHLFEKSLRSALGAGEQVRVIRARDGRDEAERVATEITRRQLAGQGRWGDFAILYRSNHQARVFEQALRTQNVPYRVTGGQSFFERTEVKDVMAYLRLIVNGADDAAFLRVVNVPRREIGVTTIRRLGDYAHSRSQPLLYAGLEAGLHGVMDGRAAARVQAFARLIVEAEDSLARDDEPAHVFARALLERIGYADWLRDTCRDARQAERCLENVDELIAWLKRAGGGDEAADLRSLLARISLLDMLDREEGDRSPDAVTLMTLHAAKGLEFPHVYLVGFEETLLPHRNSTSESAIEEERRLAYVGITRAMRSLVISHARRRKRYGEVIECEPSRFLEELPADDLLWEGRDDGRSPEERRAHGRARLADLRRLLSDPG